LRLGVKRRVSTFSTLDKLAPINWGAPLLADFARSGFPDPQFPIKKPLTANAVSGL
jgi:hypothetical protein